MPAQTPPLDAQSHFATSCRRSCLPYADNLEFAIEEIWQVWKEANPESAEASCLDVYFLIILLYNCRWLHLQVVLGSTVSFVGVSSAQSSTAAT